MPVQPVTRWWAILTCLAIALGLGAAVTSTFLAGIERTVATASPWFAVVSVLFALAAAPWLVLMIGLVLLETGRRYLRQSGSESVANVALSEGPSLLVLAGLVFAGTALLPREGVGVTALGFLVVALCAFLSAWAMGVAPAEYTTTVASDAMKWTGLAALVAGVGALITEPTVVPAMIACILTLVLMALFSARHAVAFVPSVRGSVQTV